jgi:NADH-quinone oxidoreductase subunit M
MVQRVFFNPLDKQENREIEDLSKRELAILAPLCALMIWIGWNPTPLLDRMEPSVQVVLERLDEATREDQARVEDEANEPQVVDGGQE